MVWKISQILIKNNIFVNITDKTQNTNVVPDIQIHTSIPRFIFKYYYIEELTFIILVKKMIQF